MTTARTTTDIKRDAAKIGADLQNMRNAARNIQICELDASGLTMKETGERVGVSRYVVRRVVAHDIDYWREWQAKAEAAGISSDDQSVAGDSGTPPDGGIEMIDIEMIDDNPWQPRELPDEDNSDAYKSIVDLANDIYKNGLLSPIMVREWGDRYQLVYGQRRLEAMLGWHVLDWEPEPHDDEALGISADGTGAYWATTYFDGKVTRIPAIVRVMSDAEVITASLAENMLREDLTWLDETRALKTALDADSGLTHQALAGIMGISRANVSQRVRLLQLPAPILELIDEGKLPWTTARDELMGFVGDDHIHHEELDYCAKRMPKSRRLTEGRRLATGDVRAFMMNALGAHAERWEHLNPCGYSWIWVSAAGANNSTRKYKPMFDVEEFKDAYFDYLHVLPNQYGGKILWTCRGEEWRAAQAAAEAEAAAKAQSAVEEAPAAMGMGDERSTGTPDAQDTPDQDTAAPRRDIERSGQMQDMTMADVPAPKATEAPDSVERPSEDDEASLMWAVREVTNCRSEIQMGGRYSAKVDGDDHWHVEWKATRSRWMMQSPALADFAAARAFKDDMDNRGASAWIVRHIIDRLDD